MADFVIENNGTQEQLIEKVAAVLSKIDHDDDSKNLSRRYCCRR